MKSSHTCDLCPIDSCYSLIQWIGNQQSPFHPSVPRRLSLRGRIFNARYRGGLSPPREDYHLSWPWGIITSQDTEGLSLRGRIDISRYLGGSSLREKISTRTTLRDYHSEGGLSPLFTLGDYHSFRGSSPLTTLRDYLFERGLSPLTTLGDYHSKTGLVPLTSLADYHSDRGLSPLTTLGDYHSDRGLSPLTTLGAITSWRGLSTLMNLRDYNLVEGMFCVTKVIPTLYSLNKYCRM